jgi:hypothetical protein
MKGAEVKFKYYPCICTTIALLLLLAAGCAEAPEIETDDNSAPSVDSISETGGRRVIGAGGSAVTLRATTTDIDGDPLVFDWSGPGTLTNVNHVEKTVRWFPPETPGSVDIICTATDPDGLSDSRIQSFTLALVISPSALGDTTGGQLTWAGDEGQNYLLRGEVEIPESVALTITGGADIFCDAGSKLSPFGGLTVTGGSTEVQFLPNVVGAADNFWSGIFASTSQAPLNAEGLRVFNANVGLDMNESVTEGVVLQSCGFTDCTTGINVRNTDISIQSGQFDACDKGIVLRGSNVVDIDLCNFTGGQSTCIQLPLAGNAGTVSGSFFSADATTHISVSGPNSIEFHGNVFLGGGIVFTLGSSGTVNAICNNWGLGSSEATIPARIDFGTGGSSVDFVPYTGGDDPGGLCD